MTHVTLAPGGGSFVPFTFTGGTGVGFNLGGLGGTTVTYTAPASTLCASTEVVVYDGDNYTGTAVSYVVTVGDCSSSTPIPSWVQGYGRGAATDACLEGWSPSWEQWTNGGTGGYVCTRSVPSLG